MKLIFNTPSPPSSLQKRGLDWTATERDAAAEFIRNAVCEGETDAPASRKAGKQALEKLCARFSKDSDTPPPELESVLKTIIPPYDPDVSTFARWFASFSKTAIFHGLRPGVLNRPVQEWSKKQEDEALSHFGNQGGVNRAPNWEIQRAILATQLLLLRPDLRNEQAAEVHEVLGKMEFFPNVLPSSHGRPLPDVDLDDFLQEFYAGRPAKRGDRQLPSQFLNDVVSLFHPGKAAFEFWLIYIQMQRFIRYACGKRNAANVEAGQATVEQPGSTAITPEQLPPELKHLQNVEKQNPSVNSNRARRQKAAASAFQKLKNQNQDYYEILLRKDVEGASYEELSSHLKLTPDNLRKRVSRARALLKALILEEITSA